MGPVDYIVLAFPGNQFKGEILPELQKVVDNGSVNIIDLLFVIKDEAGNTTSVELEDMPAEFAETLSGVRQGFKDLLAEADVEEASDLLENNSSGAIIIFEHAWAKNLKQAINNAGGVLVADGRVNDESVVAALDELENQEGQGE